MSRFFGSSQTRFYSSSTGVSAIPLSSRNLLPLSRLQKKLRFFPDELGYRHCAYDRGCWEDAIVGLSDSSFPARRTFDLVLAVTLHRNSVDTFFARITSDFLSFG